MTRSRPDKMDVDKPAKKEKKSSGDKVTKHERKDKKSKKAAKLKHQKTLDSSDDESSKVGLESPEQAQETALALHPYPDSADEGGALLDDSAAGIVPGEKERGSSPTASNLQNLTEQARKKQKKAERKKKERAEMLATEHKLTSEVEATAPATDETGDIFMIDVNPTPVDPRKLQPPSDDEDDDIEDGGAPLEKVGPGFYPPAPMGMNREVRRRLFLIEREKIKIQKKLGVPVDSNNKADEVKALLDEWTQEFDKRAKQKQARKKKRKAVESDRVRSKLQRKMSTGGKLPEKGRFRSKGGHQKYRQTTSRNQ